MIGAGYIAPRHAKAIKDVGGDLLAFTDPRDSVGWMDQYFPEANYFPLFERFDRHVDKLRRAGTKIDYCVIVTPNFLHDCNSRWALRNGMDAICEKPLVLNERNLDALKALEEETGHRVWGVYQLRYHPAVHEMKLFVDTDPSDGLHLSIEYRVPRGKWYGHSWKNDISKSGGLSTNIGCHLFDILGVLFGKHLSSFVDERSPNCEKGVLSFKKSIAAWSLSTRPGEPTRLFQINDELFNLNRDFTELHTEVYRQILAGNGIGIEDVRESVRICEQIRKG